MLINREQIERTLIGRLVLNPKDYYDNHNLLSPSIFTNASKWK